MDGMEVDAPASESAGDGGMGCHSERVTVSQAFQSAFVASIDGVNLFDVKLWAYTKRRYDDAGAVSLCRPRAVLANAACLMNATDHFDKVFTRGFKESHIVDISGDCPDTMLASKTELLYSQYDSDLEDEDEDEGNSDARSPTSNAPSPRRSRTSGAQSPHTGVAVQSAIDDFSEMTRSLPPDGDASSVRGSVNRTQRRLATPPGTKSGHLLSVPHIAHKTLRAFVYYSVFGVVNFAPLRSQRGGSPSADGDGGHELRRSSIVPSCSPKSMYRLAEQWNVPRLKSLAMAAIESRLSAENILPELFSSFTPLYREVEATEVEYFMEHIDEAYHTIQGMDLLDLKITATSSQAASNVIFQLMRRLLAP